MWNNYEFLPANTAHEALTEPETQKLKYYKENETSDREKSVLDTLEETLKSMSPILNPLVSTDLQQLPAVQNRSHRFQ